MGGGTIVTRRLKTTGNKNCFQPRPKAKSPINDPIKNSFFYKILKFKHN
jgi:hypothetical protein